MLPKHFKTPLLVLLCLCNTVFAQSRYTVIISEIMFDPSPGVGLPNYEWIELHNTSSAAINLKGWRIGDETGISGPMPSFTLEPDSNVIVCSSTAAAAMRAWGTTLSVSSFPSLNNDGELLFIRSETGVTLHAVSYLPQWHNNEMKQEGGWSIEIINPELPCIGQNNWTASTDPKGGTPGRRNAVFRAIQDQTPPSLIQVFAPNPQTLILTFDEPLDSASAVIPEQYTWENGAVIPQKAECLPPLFQQVQLQTITPLETGNISMLNASNITDCSGNKIGNRNTAKVGINAKSTPSGIVINELLFNPAGIGVDYIELYNRSSLVVNARELYIANRSSSGSITNIKAISTTDRPVFPGDFLLIAEDTMNLVKQFPFHNQQVMIPLSNMPSLPDDRGQIVLLNAEGTVLDEVAYDEKWHFALISNREGVALERIHPSSPSRSQDSWASASKDVRYGTPGLQNSQFRLPEIVNGTIEVKPEIFSPDQDGHDDYVLLHYQFPENGYVMNCTVYNLAGRPVKYLQRNALCRQTGTVRWDGLNEQQMKLPMGPYLIFTEVFNLRGRVKQFKNRVVLARKQ
jgi:hypothetical protein